MKLRLKIALIFTGLTSVVLAISFSFIYYFVAKNEKNDFYHLLFEKVYLTAFRNYEKDEMSDLVYQKIYTKYLQSLPGATEILLNTNQGRLVGDSLRKLMPQNLVIKLLHKQTIEFFKGQEHGIGIYYPDNQGNFIVVVIAVDKLGILREKHLLRVLLIIFSLSIIFIFVMGQIYATNIIRPIAHILKNVRRIRATNLKLRLSEKPGQDEIAQLIRTFNQMLDRLEASFISQKTFVSNASHELKNPLTAIIGEASLALSKVRQPEEYIASMNRIMVEAGRLDSVTRNLLTLANTDFDLSGMKMEPVQMDELILDIKEYFNQTGNTERIRINTDPESVYQGRLVIRGIPDMIKIAVTNIIDNACKFSDTKPVDVELFYSDGLLLRVTDRGIGIPPDDLAQLGQPFYRAGNAFGYNGAGIGLSLTRKIIEMHGGRIVFSSVLNEGTTVEVFFNLKI